MFLRRLIDLSKIPKMLHYFVRLNNETRSDIQWWRTFIGRWNGVGLLSALAIGCEKSSIRLRSDASGQWRCGAVWQRDWLQLSGHQRLRNCQLPQKRQHQSCWRRFASVIVGRESTCCLRWTTTRSSLHCGRGLASIHR